MITRVQHSSIVFRRPFALKQHDGLQPAGTYAIETEEELIEGLSFTAYRRTGTTITLQTPRRGATIQALTVDPLDLADAHASDIHEYTLK